MDTPQSAQDAYDAFSEETPVLTGMTAASVHGMIATGDRAGLEQLCSYVTRPPLAAGSL